MRYRNCAYFKNVLVKKADCILLGKGSSYIESKLSNEISQMLRIRFYGNYASKVINKYYLHILMVLFFTLSI